MDRDDQVAVDGNYVNYQYNMPPPAQQQQQQQPIQPPPVIYGQPVNPMQGQPQAMPAYGQPAYGQGYVAEPPVVPVNNTTGNLKSSNISSSDSDVKKKIAKAHAVRESGFLRKVYLILTCQILLTMVLTIVACLVKFDAVDYEGDTIKETLAMKMWEAIWPICVAVVVVIASLIVSLFVYDKVPMNFIFLTLYTIGWSVIVACVAGPVAGDGSVAAAFIITSIIFIGLTILTCIRKIRQVIWIFVLFTLLFCAIGGLITYYLWFYAIIGLYPGSPYDLYVVYCCIFAAIFSCYIVIDSLIARKADSKYNNYIYAAIRLYTDFVYLLIILIALLGGKK